MRFAAASDRNASSLSLFPTSINPAGGAVKAEIRAGINSRGTIGSEEAEAGPKGGWTAKKIDWTPIEADFLSCGAGYRALAEKYGVSLSSVKKRASAGGWQKKLLELRRGEEPEELSGPSELAKQIRQDRRLRLLDTSDVLLDKLRRTMDELEPGNAAALARLARALKDLRELQGLQKDALDLEEQRTRIEKMRSEIRRTEDENSPAGVVLLPPIGEEPEDRAEREP